MKALAYVHLRPITLHGSKYADTLWDDYKDDAPRALKLGIVSKVKDDYAFNHRRIKRKALTLRIGLFLTAIEAICVAWAVLGSRLT